MLRVQGFPPLDQVLLRLLLLPFKEDRAALPGALAAAAALHLFHRDRLAHRVVPCGDEGAKGALRDVIRTWGHPTANQRRELRVAVA